MGRRWTSRFLLLALLALAGACAPLKPAPPVTAAADHLYLVAHPDVKLSLTQVRDLYLGDVLPDAGAVLVAVDNAAAQNEFLRRVVKLERNQYEKLWERRAFRDGASPPLRLGGDAAVLAFVRKTPGAVGYVRTRPERVNVLHKL